MAFLCILLYISTGIVTMSAATEVFAVQRGSSAASDVFSPFILSKIGKKNFEIFIFWSKIRRERAKYLLFVCF
jgi:hypothetical protein